jgi:probable HAF family extracellular repeat protein
MKPSLRVRALWRGLLAGALLWGAGTCAHAGSYQVVDLGGRRFGLASEVFGLNGHGTAAGDAMSRVSPHVMHPVKTWADGRSIDLAVQDGVPDMTGRAVAINARGQTAGWLETATDRQRLVFIEQHGTMTMRPSPSGYPPEVTGMNIHGDVVGYDWSVEGACLGNCAYVIRDGQWTTLPALPNSELSRAYAINSQGLIVGDSFQGTHATTTMKAVLWRNGKVSALPGLENVYSSAADVNDSGDIVGLFRPADPRVQQHAFLWRQGTLIDLDDSPDSMSNALAVNASGQVIGTRTFASRSGYFVTVDGRMQWLDDLLLPGTGGPWVLASLTGINDAGQIIGTALDATWTPHAVRLDPVAR